MIKQMLENKQEEKAAKKAKIRYNGYVEHEFTAVTEQPIIAGSVLAEQEPTKEGNKALAKMLFERDGKGNVALGGQMVAAVLQRTLTEERWKDFEDREDFERLEARFEGALSGQRVRRFYFEPVKIKLNGPIAEIQRVETRPAGDSIMYIAEAIPMGSELTITLEAPVMYSTSILRKLLAFGISKYGLGKASARKTGLYGRCKLT